MLWCRQTPGCIVHSKHALLKNLQNDKDTPRKRTLILASRRLNIGAFLSMSGMIIYLQHQYHQRHKFRHWTLPTCWGNGCPLYKDQNSHTTFWITFCSSFRRVEKQQIRYKCATAMVFNDAKSLLSDGPSLQTKDEITDREDSETHLTLLPRMKTCSSWETFPSCITENKKVRGQHAHSQARA